MADETKDTPNSQQNTSEQEKKPAPPVATPPKPAAPSAPAVQQPRAAAPPPRPPTPAPQSRPQQPLDSGRRGFVKAMFAIGAVLSIIPFVPWGTFLSSAITIGQAPHTLLQRAIIDDETKYGAAAGRLVNVNDLSTFPPNGNWVITYPTSGDPTLDAQNPDTFQKYELIRLPEELGGSSKKATDFVAFSKVCVHLWCSPNYNPTQTHTPSEYGYQPPGPTVITHQQYECPCHGSIYEIPDGRAIDGPAALQAPPTNAIPMLTLQADADGNLYVFYPNRDPTKEYPNNQVGSIGANGDLGFGRESASYQNFIKPMGEVPADLKGLDEVVR